MMPHPERYVEPYQHPHWSRVVAPPGGKRSVSASCGPGGKKNGPGKEPDGLRLFLNAVRYVKKNLL